MRSARTTSGRSPSNAAPAAAKPAARPPRSCARNWPGRAGIPSNKSLVSKHVTSKSLYLVLPSAFRSCAVDLAVTNTISPHRFDSNVTNSVRPAEVHPHDGPLEVHQQVPCLGLVQVLNTCSPAQRAERQDRRSRVCVCVCALANAMVSRHGFSLITVSELVNSSREETDDLPRHQELQVRCLGVVDTQLLAGRSRQQLAGQVRSSLPNAIEPAGDATQNLEPGCRSQTTDRSWVDKILPCTTVSATKSKLKPRHPVPTCCATQQEMFAFKQF